MSINTVPTSRRSLPTQVQSTANGNYTLPQYAYIPDPALQQLATGQVLSPTPGGAPAAQFAAVLPAMSRPYPTPMLRGAFAIRQAQFRATDPA
jgi:hypothetical protein